VATPFLKWAGGKGRLANEVIARMPARFGRYHEPFLGAGAVYFALAARRELPGAALNDANAPLMETFIAVRDDTASVIAELERLAGGYGSLPPSERARYYYAVRAQESLLPASRAARLIFLNHTCFNGLYRVNRRGQFNVPHGRYANPRILDSANLREAAAQLASATLTAVDFEEACADARPGDLVYLDPPYFPLSATSRFTAYTSEDFGRADHQRLAAVYRSLADRGVYALLSNSAVPEIAALYEGFDLTEVRMSRAINATPGGRAPIPELLVSNVAMVSAQRVAG
jgi:DNA adenine methylase